MRCTIIPRFILPIQDDIQEELNEFGEELQEEFQEVMSDTQKWLFAIKWKSWPKVLAPFFMGQALGAASFGHFFWFAFVIGLVFTCAGLCFIVLMNDWADQRVDSIKRNMFPDSSSSKTIHDGVLDGPAVLNGAIIAMLTAIALAVVASIGLGLGELVIYSLICAGIFAAYSLPPFRMNYRGGGEFMEMLGTGLAMPLFAAYMQAHRFDLVVSNGKDFHLMGVLNLLFPVCLLCFASAIASGLSDEESDKIGGKNTIVTRWGNPQGRAWTERMLELFMPSFAIATFVVMGFGIWSLALVLPVLGIVAFALTNMKRISPKATTNAFVGIHAYKNYLHIGVWLTQLYIGVYLLVYLMLKG